MGNNSIEIFVYFSNQIVLLMKPITVFLSFFIFIMVSACGTRKKTVASPVSEPVRDIPVAKEEYTPFTRDLYTKLLSSQIDIKKVQFYIDQQLILSRGIDNNALEVSSGKIVFRNGKNTNEIIIPIYTAGKCEVVESDGLRISFEQGGKTFKFLNSRTYSPDNYIFSGANWDDKGTCEVEYDNNKFRVSCGTCGSAADAKLVVKVSELNDIKNNSRPLPGNRVN